MIGIINEPECEDSMRVAIIGGGVAGTLVAAALHEAGTEATIITRPARQSQLIGARTKITSPLGRFAAPLLAVTPDEARPPYDVAVIATRAHAIDRGAAIASALVAPGSLIVSLSDGIGHLEALPARFPGCAFAAAHFDARCTMDADGVLRQSGPAGRMSLGPMTDSGAERLEALYAALHGRRFTAEPDAASLPAKIWARHVFIAAAVGASALAGGIPFRDALRFHSRKPFEKMLDEGRRIGEAHAVFGIFGAVHRYRTAALREGEPVQAPAPLSAGGAPSDEARFLFDEMCRLSVVARVPTGTMNRAAALISAGPISPRTIHP